MTICHNHISSHYYIKPTNDDILCKLYILLPCFFRLRHLSLHFGHPLQPQSCSSIHACKILTLIIPSFNALYPKTNQSTFPYHNLVVFKDSLKYHSSFMVPSTSPINGKPLFSFQFHTSHLISYMCANVSLIFIQLIMF